jgi:hypothetical protein
MQAVPGLSTGLQAASSMFGAVAQANAYRSAAAMDLDNAKSAELQGAFEVTDIHRRGRAVQGEAMAALAEGGGSVDGGSARDVIYQNALDIEYAALSAHYSAESEARGYRFSAAQKRVAARASIVGGILGAGAAAIGGAQSASNRSAANADYSARYNAYFPGGQSMPVPPSYYGSGYSYGGGGP